MITMDIQLVSIAKLLRTRGLVGSGSGVRIYRVENSLDQLVVPSKT